MKKLKFMYIIGKTTNFKIFLKITLIIAKILKWFAILYNSTIKTLNTIYLYLTKD